MSSTSLDVSILPDDGLERNRRQLEHNLQQTDLSFHLSDSDVEYPRHSSNHLDQFNSFENRSHFDADPMHGWSYRTNDDEGIDPYGHGTLSTAAHHASVLTLSAGLGGRRQNGRREVSISGAEYDPERPLQDMIAGVDARLSAYDLDPSRSKYHPHGMSADPIAVDNTVELDRLLQSGHAQNNPQAQRSVRLRSPSVSSSSTSESDTSMTARPKLADALRRVSFSPRRPRSPQVSQRNISVDMNTTPRPGRRQQPSMKVQPPTPKEIQHEGDRSRVDRNRIGRAAEERVNRAKEDGSIRRPASAPAEAPQMSRRHATPLKGRIYLPDVTGLTSAVESPGKGLLSHLEYFDDMRPREVEVRLLNTITTVQSKLQHLEEENMVSRRRVRELELELEECKREVRKERTRMLEWESKMERDRLQQREEMLQREEDWRRRQKGKQREMDDEETSQRYKEVVEEKKALESLITTLRTHLARLTDELEQHKEMLSQIRLDHQKKEVKWEERWQEVDNLREEVERLGGEVEVLRGVVEEGLKDRSRHSASSREASVQVSFTQDAQDISRDYGRRTVRVERSRQRQPTANASQQSRGDDLSMLPQQSVEVSNPDMGMSVDEDDEEEEEDTTPSHRQTIEDSDEDEEDQLPFDPVSIPGSSRQNIGTGADRTIRTDRATASTTDTPDHNQRANASGVGETSAPFLNSEEIRRIEQEVEERRSSLSRSQMMSGRLSRLEEVTEDDSSVAPANISIVPVASEARPSAPTPGRATRPMPVPILKPARTRPASRCSDMDDDEVREAPFPQIRGARLERLFFSAPDHNQRTCTVCDRRRRSQGPHDHDHDHEPQHAADEEEDHQAEASSDDEGFAEGSEEAGPSAGDDLDRQRQAFDWAKEGKKKGLPPQTVLARVIRELEDDFTHYKGIYVELADQYKDMDAASNVRKRNILAQHLREVVDVLEQKGDQIASLYDLLNYKDKPVEESVVPPKETRRPTPTSTGSAGRASGLRRRMS
ncbi:hypothetical protein BD626DRAFT_502750 [Schizophyllum amplum]|uniref:Cep57 centrosome microtubule-binding domain-containing protein n=1 Tax=Schizophyllum amplum TaxID=97359 RepID=A0A550C8J3_9AGAR|nr:hypothetical protein BD626DRAFT_502750 [Auriculariopsis ampla]